MGIKGVTCLCVLCDCSRQQLFCSGADREDIGSSASRDRLPTHQMWGFPKMAFHHSLPHVLPNSTELVNATSHVLRPRPRH